MCRHALLPARERIPDYLAAVGQRDLGFAGWLADGRLPATGFRSAGHAAGHAADPSQMRIAERAERYAALGVTTPTVAPIAAGETKKLAARRTFRETIA